jgi:hypothetical protein
VTAQDLTVGIDLGTESENERRELTDLVMYFLTMEMDKRRNQLLGRSIFDDEFVQNSQPGPWSQNQSENYQIVLLNRHALAGEAEIPRQGGSGEQQDLIYINRITIPVTAMDYVDRQLQSPYGYLDQATIKHATPTQLPAGDHVPPVTGDVTDQ